MAVIDNSFIGIKEPVIKRSLMHLMRELIKLSEVVDRTDKSLQEQIDTINVTLINLENQVEINVAILNSILNGETLPIETEGGQQRLYVRDDLMTQLLTESLKEMKKINMQLAEMNDMNINNSEIKV